MKHSTMEEPAVSTVMKGTALTPTSTHRPRQRITVFLPLPLIERLRNAVYWTEHRPLAQIIAEAIDDAVTELEHTNGGVFPQRLSALKPGRPRRSRTPASPSSSLQSLLNDTSVIAVCILFSMPVLP